MRTVFVRYFEIRRLNASIARSTRENELLRQRIYFLENEPAFLERMVRAELGVIAEGEIEYRFTVPR
ncbi:MAG: septum formation initiator family protein [Elusimicrobia bacterium]|nr:septum formation initiator family protein [Elusimicrobiota bacterium]